jgi:hypothetical protein
MLVDMNEVDLTALNCKHTHPSVQTSDNDPASSANGGAGTKTVEQP